MMLLKVNHLHFLCESVTVIVQFVVGSFTQCETKVIELFPEVADVVLEEQEPPYVIVPASEDENT